MAVLNNQIETGKNIKMHDIVFINPPNHCKDDFIPLGLRNLYTIIKKAGYKTGFIDLQKLFITGELKFDSESLEKIYGIIDSSEAEIYAFTLWNTSFPWVTSICKYIKKTRSKSFTIIGGPLSTLSSEQILKDYECIDVACRFEGEPIIEPLVKELLSSGLANIGKIENLAFRDKEGTVISTDNAPLIEDLDLLPFIDVSPSDFKSPVINLEAGRGCSFNCYYCSSCYIWKFKPRYKSGNRLFSEIENISSQYKKEGLNPPVFHLEHDNFLMKPEILVELDERVKQTGLKFRYGFAGRADLITEKNLDLLKSTGCLYVYLGIETGSARMQKITKKNLSFEKIFSSVLRLQKKSIMVNANLMYGFPEETLDDLYSSLGLMNTLRHLGVNVHVSMLSPELKTRVGESANISDYVFNCSSRYFCELTDSGFKPSEYKKIYVNHLYTLNNNNYDILTYNRFVLFWHEMLTGYPLTVYSIMKNCSSDWNMIFSVWKDNFQGWTFSGASADSIMKLAGVYNQNFGKDGKDSEIVGVEHILYMNKNKYSQTDILSKDHLRRYYEHYNCVRDETIAKLGLNTCT